MILCQWLEVLVMMLVALNSKWKIHVGHFFTDGLTGKERNASLMYRSKRRTLFVGLLCLIDSVLAIYTQYVAAASAPLKYFLTYKISQDHHIELFFGAVRAALGSNNNPTVRQFASVYKVNGC